MNTTRIPRDYLPRRARQVHAEALKRGRLYITGDITNESIYYVFEPLHRMMGDRKLKAINVYISSPGGQARIGLTIAKFLMYSPKLVRTFAFGEVCSAAAAIFLGGHERIVLPGAEILLHDSWISDFDGATGEHSKRIARMHENFDKEQLEFIVLRTGLERGFVEHELSADHWYVNADQAYELGIANDR